MMCNFPTSIDRGKIKKMIKIKEDKKEKSCIIVCACNPITLEKMASLSLDWQLNKTVSKKTSRGRIAEKALKLESTK